MKKLLLLCLLLVLQTEAFARLSCFKQIGIEDGLSQSTVETVLRDRKGLLWIGTEGGLNLYDNPDIITFRHNPNDPNSLPSDKIYTLQEDNRGYIWVGTSEGLSVINPSGFSFEMKTDGTVHTSIRHINRLFFGGIGIIYEYDMDTGLFSSIPLPEKDADGSSASRYVYLASENEDALTVGTLDGQLYRFSVSTRAFIPIREPFIHNIYGLFKVDKGDLFVSSYKDGIFRLDTDFNVISHWTSENSGLQNDVVNGFMEENGCLYCATDGGGISVLDTKNGRLLELYQKSDEAGALPTNSINLIQKDKSGNIWVGTVRSGLLFLHSSIIRTFGSVPTDYSGESSGLSEKSIASLYEDRQGKVWIGTDGNGLNEYDPKKNSFRHYSSTKGMSVCSITEFDSRLLLISAFNSGVFLFDKKTGSISKFIVRDKETDETVRKSLTLLKVHRITEDRILILGRGMFVYDDTNGRFTRLDSGVLRNAVLTCLDEDNVYLIANAGSDKIYRMEKATGKISLFKDLASGESIRTVAKGIDGMFYVGSDHGLCIYDPISDSVSRYHTDLFGSVKYLTLDRANRLWIAAENYLFTIESGNITSWGESDGFIPNEINNSYQASPLGANLYLGGSEGFVQIETDQIRIPRDEAIISLWDVDVDGTHTNSGVETVRVPSDYRVIGVSVCSNVSDVFRVRRYRYTIEKSDMSRIVVYGGNHLTLPVLSDGKYTMGAAYLKRDGLWSEEFPLTRFIVMRPWYRSIVALVFYIIAFLTLACLLHIRNRIRICEIIREKERQEEQARQRRKLQNLMIMCHELRAPLNLIYMPLKNLLKSTWDEGAVKDSLKGIFHQTCHMRDVVNMVLDLSKMKSGALDLDLSLLPFNEWMENVISPYVREFSEKGIRLEYMADPELGPVKFDDKKIRLVVSNLLSNALKFSPSDTCVKVSVSHDSQFLRVDVQDQGIGLGDSDPEQLFRMFYQKDSSESGNGIGLAYSKELIQMHGGTISASANPEGGSIFSFSIPYFGAGAVETDLSEQTVLQDTKILDADFSLYCAEYSMLVIDDCQEFNQYLRNELSYCFKHIFTAYDGNKGLAVALDKKPDIILCNLVIPGMDGVELCRRIKEDASVCNATVIMMTEERESEKMASGYREGTDYFISKPFDIDLLINIIYNSLKNKERIRKQYHKNTELMMKTESGYTLTDAQFAVELEKLILENISNPDLDVPFLMSSMNYGRTTFYARVKSVTGVTVTEYINRVRVAKAKHIIETTQLTLSEISYRVGCSSLSRFSVIFKQYTGMTPTEYKKSL